MERTVRQRQVHPYREKNSTQLKRKKKAKISSFALQSIVVAVLIFAAIMVSLVGGTNGRQALTTLRGQLEMQIPPEKFFEAGEKAFGTITAFTKKTQDKPNAPEAILKPDETEAGRRTNMENNWEDSGKAPVSDASVP